MAPRRESTKAYAPKPEQDPKSKVTTSGRTPSVKIMPSRTSSELIARTLVNLLLAVLSEEVCKLCLSPVYGSIPATKNLNQLLVPLVWLSIMLPYQCRSHFAGSLPIWGIVIPIIQPLLFRFSGRLGPLWGPSITSGLTSFPLLFGALRNIVDVISEENLLKTHTEGSAIKKFVQYVEDLMARNAIGGIAAQDMAIRSFRGLFNLFLTSIFSQSISALQGIATLMIRQVSSTGGVVSSRYGMQVIVACLWALLSHSKLAVFISIPMFFRVAFFNSHLPLAYNTALVNSTLQGAGYSLIVRQESLTGYISVLDNIKDGFRIMRCDHSLLGGEWINKPEGHPAKLNEPIYSIFVMLEAVRLVETESLKSPLQAVGYEKEALVIGLGVGTAPAALIAHGVHTTTVEIDPVVHDFASQYFDLPQDHKSIIGDAVKVVHDMRTTEAEQTYDYIIHDVFTGGAEPIDLFTLEFILGLHDLLNPQGTVAINYAGDLLLPSAISVIRTVMAVFPNCRLFRESPTPMPLAKEDFTNLVIYCRKSTEAFTFRTPSEADFLGSSARQEHLLPRNEIEDIAKMVKGKGQIIKNGHMKRLEVSQMSSAMGHWHVMRTVLPDLVWENW